ncbi:AAA family ATPase [Deinococcus navajonensis]|uniref:AAA family ATPase n=1 Tax=Deinococcus navajonensis TaxID=309884 RepID=A0ABV8XR48_9DEIO
MIRIARVDVEAYAGLKQRSFNFESSGPQSLTVLYGPNEAGKSTLLEFIREVLFGTGEALGSVVLEAQGRRYRVTASGRRQRRVMDLTSGETCAPETVRELLGSIDRTVFQNIFAFGLGELQTLTSLTSQGVQERIFAAGVAGAGPSARAAVNRLEAEVQDYLRPRAQSKLTSGALAYQEVQSQLREARSQADGFAVARHEIQRMEDDLREDQQSLQDLVEREHELEAFARLWPQWAERQAALSALEALEVPPARAAGRAHEAQELLRQTQERRAERARLAGELGALPEVPQTLLDAQAGLESLSQELGAYQERLSALGAAEHQRQVLQLDLSSQQEGLGGSWTTDQLVQLYPEQLAPVLEEPGRALEAARVALQAAERELERSNEAAQLTREALAVAQVHGPGESPEERLALDAVDAARQRQQEAQADLDALMVDDALRTQMPALQALLREAPSGVEADLRRLEADAEEQLGTLREILADLGPAWTEEALGQVTAETERGWRQAGQRHGQTWASVRGDLEEARRTVRARRAAVQEAQTPVDTWPETRPLTAIDAQLKTVQTQVALAASARTRLLEHAPSRGPAGPAAQNRAVSAALTLALVVTGFLGHPLLGLLALVCGGALMWVTRPQQPAMVQAGPLRTDTLHSDLEALGLGAQADAGQLAALESRLAGQVSALHREAEAARRAHEAQARLQAEQTLLNEALLEQTRLQTLMDEAAASFACWAEATRLPLEGPEDLEPVLTRLSAARQGSAQRQRLLSQWADRAREVQQFEARVHTVLESLQRPAQPGLLTALVQAVEAAESAQRAALRREDLAAAARQYAADAQRAADYAQTVTGRLRAAWADLEQAHQRAQAAVEKCQSDQKAAADRWAQALAAWEAQLAALNLPSGSPAELRVLIERLARAADTARRLTELGVQWSELQRQTAGFEQRSRAALQAATGEGREPADLLPVVVAARAANDQARQRDGLLQRLAGVDEQLAQLEQHALALLAAAQAPDLLTLLRWDELSSQRQDLQQRVSTVDHAVHVLAGHQAAGWRVQLDQAQPEAWARQLQEIKDKKTFIQDAYEQRHQALARLQLAARLLADSSDTARLHLQAEAVAEQLRRDLRAWVVRRLGARVLADTLREYERTKGPEVLRHASQVFARFSHGRYTAVRQVEGSTKFRVLTSGDELVDVEQLSRGTQEQLYLAVRLGLARTLGQRTANLPLMMDDILVNADPVRAHAVAETLAELSADHQVIYLTCHPSSVQLLQQLVPGSNTVELPRLNGPAPAPQRLATDVAEELASRGVPCTVGELRDALPHLSDSEIQTQIETLKRQGRIVQIGRAKGTRYSLMEEALPVSTE